jgi:DNA polymerase III subunit delta
MKIAPKLIESYLTKPDAGHRAALFFGPDAGMVRDRAKRLIAAYLGVNHDPFALVELAEAALLADAALLSDELSAISMMAPRRVLLIRDAGDKLTKIIEGAADSFHGDCLLVVCGGELSTRSSLRVWFEKTPATASIACYHDEARDVQEVIRKSFDAAQVRADRDTLEYLAQHLGNDRYVTYQELEKLITYAGEAKQLTLHDVQALVDYNRETSFDDMVNAVADRNLKSLESTLTRLLREGSQPVAYLRALQRYFNRLYFIRAQMQALGQSAEMVIQGLRPPVFFRQVPILTRHVQSWNSEQIVRALRLLINAELACKTSDLPLIPASSRRLLQITQIR